MSGITQLPLFGGLSADSGAYAHQPRASLYREMQYLLTISTQTSRPNAIRPAGLVHSLGVCLIEDWNMARGKGQESKAVDRAGLPRFVDVKLTPQQRQQFQEMDWTPEGATKILQDFANTGYRVGVAWSGEHQTYTVSLTCRDEESPNNGLCMTCFAGDLIVGIGLAVFKHTVVAKGVWNSVAIPPTEGFG